MARQPRTPGATEAPKTTETEVVTTTTADQADAALNAMHGVTAKDNRHVPASDATTPKRTRQVLGEKGWATEEY